MDRVSTKTKQTNKKTKPSRTAEQINKSLSTLKMILNVKKVGAFESKDFECDRCGAGERNLLEFLVSPILGQEDR